MIYRDFKGKKLSMLGFGTMRLPLLPGGTETNIDEAQVEEMVRHAMEHGINYYDTAYPYHGGFSELVIGRILKKYPRDSFYLATKFPGHQVASTYEPAVVFEDQLKKCQVEYFDFYLLHNICENSMPTYNDPKWGIIDYFIEEKRKGRIHHLGFSAHAEVDTLREFLEKYGKEMEFCQIQLNYMDWTLQKAKEKCELLAQWDIPVWVMEPLRGGRLAKLSDADEAKLRALRPDDSIASWGLRWVQGVKGVKMILSGMSNMAQMEDNVATFEADKPLSRQETELLYEIAEGMKRSVPCTACRYCYEGCPMGLDIPMLLATYNDLRFAPITNTGMRIEALPPEKRPEACIACGKCAQVCPQKINIPEELKGMAALLETVPKWSDLCRTREEAARKLREQNR